MPYYVQKNGISFDKPRDWDRLATGQRVTPQDRQKMGKGLNRATFTASIAEKLERAFPDSKSEYAWRADENALAREALVAKLNDTQYERHPLTKREISVAMDDIPQLRNRGNSEETTKRIMEFKNAVDLAFDEACVELGGVRPLGR